MYIHLIESIVKISIGITPKIKWLASFITKKKNKSLNLLKFTDDVTVAMQFKQFFKWNQVERVERDICRTSPSFWTELNRTAKSTRWIRKVLKLLSPPLALRANFFTLHLLILRTQKECECRHKKAQATDWQKNVVAIVALCELWSWFISHEMTIRCWFLTGKV